MLCGNLTQPAVVLAQPVDCGGEGSALRLIHTFVGDVQIQRRVDGSSETVQQLAGDGSRPEEHGVLHDLLHERGHGAPEIMPPVPFEHLGVAAAFFLEARRDDAFLVVVGVAF